MSLSLDSLPDITTGNPIDATKTTAETKEITYEGGDGKRMWFAYNGEFKDLSDITQGPLPVLDLFEKTTATYLNHSYKIYYTKELTVDSNTFKFVF